MKNLRLACSRFLPGARLAGPLAWVWVTVAAAALAFGGILWVQARQNHLIAHLTSEEILLRQARVDLTEGYLHLALGERPGGPFDRAQGLARLGQACSALEKVADLQSELEGISAHPPVKRDLAVPLAEFVRSMAQFREQALRLPDAPPAEAAWLTESWIAFFALERQAEQIEEQIQRNLSDTILHFDEIQTAITAGAGLLLLLICLGAVASNRGRKRTELALNAGEERLRLALDAARMGTFDYDLQAQRIAWTRLHEELWGFRPGEFDGTFAAFAARVHPDDLPGIQAEMDRCREARAPFRREFRVVWPDASVHWISSLGQFEYDRSGRAARFRGAAMEITARKREDDLRRESDERFRNLILRSPVPTGIVESDGSVSLINDRGRQLFGYAPADIPTLADWWRRAFPDDAYRQEAMGVWNAALEAAVRNRSVVEPREFNIMAKDGSRRAVEVAGLPLPGGGIMATFIDVTRRQQAETRQKHLTDALRAIRNVNQLIVHEKDPAALLRQACDLLIESRSYRCAWIVKLAGGDRLQLAGLAGGQAEFDKMRAQLDRNEWPRCCREALDRPDVVVVHDTAANCRGCPLAATYADQSALAVAIRHGPQVYGVLVATLPRALAADAEEQGLLAEVAGDLGFALFSIASEQQRQLAEKHLLFQNMLLDETGRIAKVGGWSFDALTGEGFWTDEVARIHDLEPGATTTRDIGIGFYVPGSREKIQAAVQAAVADGTPYDLELEIISAKGVRKWVRTIGHPVKENGRVVRVQGSFQDITDQRRALEALQASEHQFRAFVENAPDAIFIQTRGCFAYVNPAAVKLFGATSALQLLGTLVIERFPPDFRPQVLERIRQLNADRRPVSQAMEPVLRCDGTRTDAEFSGVPIEYRGDRGALVFVRDITERRQAEARLHESEMWRNLATDAARLGMWDWDLAAHRITWSPINEALWGFAPGTFPGTEAAFTEHVHPEDLPELWQAGEKALQARAPFQVEFRVVWPDGSLHWLASYGQYFFDAAGQPVRLAGVAFDITARKQAEEQLRQNEAQLRLFIEHAPAALAMFDREMRYLAVSRRWLADYGLEGRELLGRSHYEIFPEIGAELKQIHRRGLAGEVVKGDEDRFARADGSVQYLRWEMHPWRDAGGGIGGIVIFTEDVTQRRLAEEALRENEARLSTALDMAQAGYWEYDVASDTFTFNDHFYRVCKTTVAAVGGYHMTSKEYAQRYCHPDDAPLVAREIAAAIASPDPAYSRVIEHRILCGDGSVGYLAVRFFIVKDAAGRTVKTYGVNQNITERKQNEIRIQEALDFLDRIIELSPFAMWVAGRDGTILRVNRALCDIIHLTADQIVGRYNVLADTNLQTQGVMPQVRAVFERQVPARFCIPWQAAAAGEVDFHGARDLFVDATLFPILDARGELANVVCQWVDVTLQKQAELALRESETRFRTLVDSAPEGIFVQADGRFLFVNPALVRLLGAARTEDILGREFQAFIAPEFHAAIRERIRLQRETGTAASPMEQEYLRLDGSRVPVESTAMPVRFANRDAHLVFLRDISERKRNEAEQQKLQTQLIQAQKMDSIGRLAGGVAHDFNNMLGVILGHADMALENLPPDRPCFANLQEIRKAGIRSADLTRQLLAFARKQPVAPRLLDLNETIEGMLKMLRRLIGENIELVWQPGRTPAAIEMDPSQLDQILANLCVNARDAIAGNGRITITTECVALDAEFCAAHPDSRPGDFVRLAVRDTGSGMNSDTLAHLFEPFFTTKAVGKGTGLGLSTVYGIVNQNRGFITVQSAPGRGSTFNIHLPRQAAEAAPAATETPAPPAGGRETILLAEDEPAVLDITRQILVKLGYRVLAAATPAEALRLVAENPARIDLLLTDVVMPEMNGRELARLIRERQPRIKRLFMSGHTTEVMAVQGILEARVHYIQKPFTPAGLAAKIRETLAAPAG